MVRIVSLLLSLALASSQIAIATDRTLVAEGDCVAQTKDGSKPLTHWKLWRLENGEYEVVDTSTKNAASVQIFRFDAQFLPIGYTIKSGPISDVPIKNFPKIPGWTISCQYKSTELNCEAESSGGRTSKASIPAKPPYVFIGECYDLDFAWFMTGVVALASRNNASKGIVNVYALMDGSKLGEIGLKPDSPIKIVFAGEETAQAMGKTQIVRKYEWGSNDIPVLRVTAQGLVASLSGKSNPAIVFEMSNYREYEPWGAPVASLLSSTPAPEPETATSSVATSGPTKRVQVASGVMAGLLIHRVSPVYPESAKQNHVQGKVVLRAVIGSDGKVIDLKSISGPTELIPAAINAVQEWQYRPYISSGEAVEVETQITVNFTLSR